MGKVLQQPTMHSHGPQASVGSRLHEEGGCTPCAFYCFKKSGCGKGVDCEFCHMAHTSNKKLRQLEWRKKQHTQSRPHRRSAKDAVGAPDSQEQPSAEARAPERPGTRDDDNALTGQPSLRICLNTRPSEPCFLEEQLASTRRSGADVKVAAPAAPTMSGAQRSSLATSAVLGSRPRQPCFIEILPSGGLEFTWGFSRDRRLLSV